MHKELLASSIAEHITFSYTCSGGNGGQNVNKVQTKVHAFIQLNTLNGLSSAEMQQLRRNLAGKITGAGTIHVTVQEQRSREQNRITALARMEQLIVTAARLPAKRKGFQIYSIKNIDFTLPKSKQVPEAVFSNPLQSDSLQTIPGTRHVAGITLHSFCQKFDAFNGRRISGNCRRRQILQQRPLPRILRFFKRIYIIHDFRLSVTCFLSVLFPDCPALVPRTPDTRPRTGQNCR